AFDPANPDEVGSPAGDAPPVRVARRLDYKADSRGWVGEARQQIFLVDVATGERRRLTGASVDHGSPWWSPDGHRLASVQPSLDGAGSRLAIVDAVTGETTLVGPEEGAVVLWAWSPAGDRVAFAGDTRSSGQDDFFVYDLASGVVRR